MYHESRRDDVNTSRDLSLMAAAPTLSQINSDHSHSAKRAKHCMTAPYYNSSDDSDSAVFGGHQSSVALDQLLERQRATTGESRAGGTDHLSASFKSLYKSIFGHSVSSGEYLNPPPLPPSTITELTCSESGFPLGASAFSLLSNVDPTGTNYSPHFYTLMDSFRDIAETNGWDKLEPSQVEGLMASFRAVDRDQFGLDPESYSRVSLSFEQFFQQLNSKLVTGNRENHPTDIEEYQSSLPGSCGNAAQPLVDTLSPTFEETPDNIMFPISGTSPPTAPNYPPQCLYISPPSPPPSPPNDTIHASPHHVMSDMQQLSTQTSHIQHKTDTTHFKLPPPYLSAQGLPADVASRTSVASDLYDNEDEDDFDWSKLM